jgi:uncharacterized protein (DUF433 family)
MTLTIATEKIPLRVDESGTIRVGGTRVPIEYLFDWLDEYSLDEFLDNFPSVERSQAVALLQLAKTLILDENTLRRMPTAYIEA